MRHLLLVFTALAALASSTQAQSIFGQWTQDEFGLPAFNYSFMEATDPRSPWPNSEGGWPLNRIRTDHFTVFGNARVNVLAKDDGYVQLFTADRGFSWLNWFEPDHDNLGGGFSYLKATFRNTTFAGSSAYMFTPDNVTVSRTFGIGYARYVSDWSAVGLPLQIQHTLVAPFGDLPALVDEVVLHNGDAHNIIDLSHYEFFDVNYHQLQTELLRSGVAAPVGDWLRDELNQPFLQSASGLLTNASAGVAWVQTSMTLPAGQPPACNYTAACGMNWYPPTVFLASATGDATMAHVNQSAFFGLPTEPPAWCVHRQNATAQHACPQAVLSGAPPTGLSATSALLQPAMLALQSDMVLAPGATRTLRFVYGYAGINASVVQLAQSLVNDADILAATAAGWDASVATVTMNGTGTGCAHQDTSAICAGANLGGAALLSRELQWRTAFLQQSSVYQEYFGVHLVPQGSAYLYLHGLDGAPRDFALFAAALPFVNPLLAKETLQLTMATADAATGKLSYGYGAYGTLQNAFIHNAPDDLDVFLLFGLAQYSLLTGDATFWSQHVAFYPPTSSALPPGAQGTTVLDHARAAMTHLQKGVGLGPHGLLALGDGDWSDGILYNAGDPLAVVFTRLYGESVETTAMAAVVLPRIAAVIEPLDPALAQTMRTFASRLRPAVRACFGGKWFGRAWFRTGTDIPYLYGNDAGNTTFHPAGTPNVTLLHLQGQVWPLLDAAFPWPGTQPLLSPSEAASLLATIYDQLNADSPIGPRLVPGGQVWPAVSQLLTLATTQLNSPLAWQLLNQHTWAVHAATFPEAWVGVWSGPDGFVSTVPRNSTDQPGGTWASAATPMTDFPVANANADAMFLTAATAALGVFADARYLNASSTRVAGCITVATGAADPVAGGFDLNTPLLRVSVTPTSVVGSYTPANGGYVWLQVLVPASVISPPAVVCSSCDQDSTRWHASEHRLSLLLVLNGPLQRVTFQVLY